MEIWWLGECRPSQPLRKGWCADDVQRDPGVPERLKLALLDVKASCPALGVGLRTVTSPGFLTAGHVAPHPIDPNTVDIQGVSLLAKMV